jgi:hypothetical protein
MLIPKVKTSPSSNPNTVSQRDDLNVIAQKIENYEIEIRNKMEMVKENLQTIRELFKLLFPFFFGEDIENEQANSLQLDKFASHLKNKEIEMNPLNHNKSILFDEKENDTIEWKNDSETIDNNFDPNSPIFDKSVNSDSNFSQHFSHLLSQSGVPSASYELELSYDDEDLETEENEQIFEVLRQECKYLLKQYPCIANAIVCSENKPPEERNQSLLDSLTSLMDEMNEIRSQCIRFGVASADIVTNTDQHQVVPSIDPSHLNVDTSSRALDQYMKVPKRKLAKDNSSQESKVSRKKKKSVHQLILEQQKRNNWTNRAESLRRMRSFCAGPTY